MTPILRYLVIIGHFTLDLLIREIEIFPRNNPTRKHSMATPASQIHITRTHLGVARIDDPDQETLDLANSLLQTNHDAWHMYFQDIGGHNHIPHSLMTVLAMGGNKSDIERAYRDGERLQRPIPPSEPAASKELSDPEKFKKAMVKLSGYTSFLRFFEAEIDAKGWKAVVDEFCFSCSPNADDMFSQLFEGLYHPLIHLGFGIEFDQPSIVAEVSLPLEISRPDYVSNREVPC